MGLVDEMVAERKSQGISQRALAALSGISQPVIAAYESGTREPGLRSFETLAAHLGLRFVPQAVADVEAVFSANPTMRREAMLSLVLHHQIVIELLVNNERTRAKASSMLNRLREKDSAGHARSWLDQWDKLLKGDELSLIRVMLDPSSDAADLRQVAPFAGVIDQETRTLILDRLGRVRREYARAS